MERDFLTSPYMRDPVPTMLYMACVEQHGREHSGQDTSRFLSADFLILVAPL